MKVRVSTTVENMNNTPLKTAASAFRYSSRVIALTNIVTRRTNDTYVMAEMYL